MSHLSSLLDSNLNNLEDQNKALLLCVSRALHILHSIN